MTRFMASSSTLAGVSLFSTVSTHISSELRQNQCPDKCFAGPSPSSFLGCSLLAQPSWGMLKTRQHSNANAPLALPFPVRLGAPLCVSIQAGQTEFAEKEQQKKVQRKRRTPRRKTGSKSVDSPKGSDRAAAAGSVKLLLPVADDNSVELSSPNSDQAEGVKESGKKLLSDLVQICWQSGDPLGRKVLGKSVVKWIVGGMGPLVNKVVQEEERGNTEGIDEIMKQAGFAFIAVAQPYLAENPMPLHQEAMCLKASTHYPTLFDHFQRGLQEALQDLQKRGVVENWQQTHSWKLLKQHAKSDGHRKSTRKPSEIKHGELGIKSQKKAIIQDRIDKFVASAFELLRVERDAELDATQHSLDSVPAEGNPPLTPEEVLLAEEDLHPETHDTIRNLIAVSSSTGLGGMHLVTLSAKGGERLPPSWISPGDMVCVRVSDRKGAGATECMRGSVYSFGEDGTSIAVAVEARYGDPTFSRLFGRPLRIDRISDLADATTYQRDCEALDRLQKHGLQKKTPAVSIVETLFGDGLSINWLEEIGSDGVHDVGVTFDRDFDDSQRKAINVGLDNQRPVAIIQGPPGTGKTKVVVEIIRQAVARGEKVLATAPTNAAVDNLVERLALAGVNVVRVGNPARVAPTVVAKSLSHIVESNLAGFRRDLGRRRADLRSDLRQCLRDESMEAGIRQMLKQIGRQLKHKEKELVDDTLKQAEVILCTNTGAGDPLVRQTGQFELVVIDEAGQAIEPSCWIPLLLGKRAVLSGDICQLAPTILSRQAMEGGLGVSLMERASGIHGGRLSTMLTIQYRMHKVIAEWSSQEMYKGLLKSSPSVKSRLLCHSPEVEPTWITQVPLLLLDTRLAHGSLIAGCEECMDPAGTGSFFNEGEVDIVMEHIRALLSAGVAPGNIAVQSPYLAQVQLLRDRAEGIPGAQGVQIASVDSFQGREADAVIISMVRSNRLGVVGFLGDNRRMNVAITRARKHVAMVCDSTTVSRNTFLRKLLHYVKHNGEVRCAFQGWSISGLLKSRLPSS